MEGNFSELKFKTGVKDGLPIGLGYLSVAFAFGVQASLLGIPVIIALLISMTNLTSAGQLAGLTVIATGGTFIEIILTQLVINSRYFIMSISLSQKTDDSFSLKHRLLCSAGITDEIFAVSSSKQNKIGKNYFYGLMLLPYVGWTLGTLFGAIAGNVLPSIISASLGIALYSMFIAIIIPPSLKSIGVLFAVMLGAGLSCCFFFISIFKVVSSGFATVICAIVSSMITALIFPVKDDTEDTKESGV